MRPASTEDCTSGNETITQNAFALALKNRVYPETFYCIEYTFSHSGFLSNLHLPWKTEGALDSLHWNIFCHSRFLSNLHFPWKQSLPWKFSSRSWACPENRVYPTIFPRSPPCTPMQVGYVILLYQPLLYQILETLFLESAENLS